MLCVFYVNKPYHTNLISTCTAGLAQHLDVQAPGGLFTSLYFLNNLSMGPIGWNVTLDYAGKAGQEQTL